MKTKKQKLIEQYENMMIEYDVYDVFVDDILPKVNKLSYRELKKCLTMINNGMNTN